MTNESNNLETVKERLKALRAEAETINAAYAERKAGLDAEVQRITATWESNNAELLAEREEVLNRLNGTDEMLRDILVETWRLNGEKAFGEGLSVRVTEKLAYSESDAIEWSKVNAPAAIKQTIDKKAFEALAKTQALDFVSIEQTPTAVIAKQL